MLFVCTFVVFDAWKFGFSSESLAIPDLALVMSVTLKPHLCVAATLTRLLSALSSVAQQRQCWTIDQWSLIMAKAI